MEDTSLTAQHRQVADPIVQAHAAFISYPRVNALAQDIEECRQTSLIAGEPHCMALEGPTGAGKSTLIKRYIAAYARVETPNGTNVPLLYVETPSQINVKGMVTKMLQVLGDPAAEFLGRKVLAELNYRLVNLLASCSVQLIVLDDFHNLTGAETSYVLTSVSTWLKALIKETGIPFLVVGVEGRVNSILRANPELSRLFAVRETLYPFCWDTNNKATIKEFAKFIEHAEAGIGMPLTDAIARTDLLYRIYYCTNGVVANIMNMLRYAESLTLQRGDSQISLADLSAAYKKRLSQHVIGKTDPFVQTPTGLIAPSKLVTVEAGAEYAAAQSPNRRGRAKQPRSRVGDMLRVS